MKKRKIHLEYLAALKANSNTKAFIETREQIELTSAEVEKYDLPTVIELLRATIVRLLCDYWARINEKRREQNKNTIDFQFEDNILSGEWKIPGISFCHEVEGTTHTFLRYFDDPDPHDTEIHYCDPTTGSEITGAKLEALERILRKKNRYAPKFAYHIIDVDNITELSILDSDGEPDIDIISTIEE